MKKHFIVSAMLAMSGLLMACQPSLSLSNDSHSSISSSSLSNRIDIDQGGMHVFPVQSDGFIGDPMPYFDGEKMNVFYLHDARDGQRGFHPWYLMQTDDFVHWDNRGLAIPYVNDYASQDLALGTGSVIQDANGLYHAFYTGFNGTGNTDYKEMIQHATSPDLVTWTKIPADGFYGGTDDFRDPYVLYMEEENLYWMLVTTRVSNRGVLKLYKSSNLKTWSDNGVFFWNDVGTWNMECPTLIHFGDYWYLSFSEQGANRIVHYRYTSDLSSGWTRPTVDYFDGIGFYAGRMEKAYDRLFVMGWVGTKEYDYDGGDFNWAGNLVTHELVQNPNGEIRPVIVKEIVEQVATRNDYPLQSATSGLISSENQLIFNPKSGYDYVLYSELSSNVNRLTFDVHVGTTKGKFGLTFNATSDYYGNLNVVFNGVNNKLEFYNVDPMKIGNTTPQISIPFQLNENSILHVTALMEGQCLTLYINDYMALTTRMYDLTGNPFGFFGMKTNSVIGNIAFYE